MQRKTKAKRLSEQIEDEYLEVEHIYRILKTNIVPESHTDSASYKVEGMKLLKTAMDALEEAATYIRDIK